MAVSDSARPTDLAEEHYDEPRSLWRESLGRLLRYKPSVFALVVITGLAFMALFADTMHS